jgi:hypothetical protein
MPYEARLPEGLPSLKIDTADERYKQLEALATSQKWTQETFSSVLGIEARRVMAAAPKAAPTAAASPAAPRDFSKMSTRELFAHGLAHGSTPSKRG